MSSIQSALILMAAAQGESGSVVNRFNGFVDEMISRVAEGKSRECFLPRLAAELRGQLEISSLVILRNRFAVAVAVKEYAAAVGAHCAKPLKSTGAGDRFNAGDAFAPLLGGNLEPCSTLGRATAGFFARSAASPSRLKLHRFRREWKDGLTE